MAWTETTLGAIAPFSYGKSLPQSERKSGTVPVYGSGGITGFHSEALIEGPACVIGRKGSVGRTYFANGPSWPIDTTFYTHGSNVIDLDYLYFLLQTLPLQESSDSAVPGLNRDYAHSLNVRIPDKFVQQRIANTLKSLDSKIRINSEISSTLETIAQTIFKSWFVDFDPVHAKARGEQLEGMDAETAALFPDSFEDSELGPIPAGWKLGVIGDLGRIITGKTPSTKKPQYWSDGTYPFITIPDLHESRFPVRTQRFVSQTGSSSQPTTKLPPYSVVVSCIATAGLIGLTTVESHTNQQINAVVVEEKENAIWVLNKLIALSPEIRNQSAIGTVFPNLSKSGFSEIRIVIPPLPLIEEYSESISSFVEMQIHLESESAKLAEIRDLLLPRLISGELEIPEELLGE